MKSSIIKIKILLISATALFSFSALAQEVHDSEILKYGFNSPLVKTFGLINKKVETIEELSEQMKSFYIPAESFYDAYDSLKLVNHAQVNGNIFKLTYSLAGKEYDSYSLTKYSEEAKSSTAILIIPGSGDNQATEIFNGEGYHRDIVEQVKEFGDVFITVKPNDDFLAIHNGWSKLNYAFLTHYLINMNGSYSASYLINSIATVKLLKEQYKRVIIVGLSQGGSAALLNSLQSSPDATVVASGFTITREDFEWAFQDQIVIPGLVSRYSNSFLHERIGSQATNYFFSWATNEIGIYKMEAHNGYTRDFFKDLTNIEYLSHNQGHNYPVPQTNQFLSKIPLAELQFRTISTDDCNDEFYLKTINLKPQDDLSFSWFREENPEESSTDSLSVLQGGNYKVVATNQHGKIFSRSFDIVNSKVTKSLSFAHNTLHAPDGFEYQWVKDGTSLPGSFASEILVEQPGVYSVFLKNELGCITSETITITDTQLASVDKLAATVLPNPNNGKFSIRIETPYKEPLQTEIYNSVGVLVYRKTEGIQTNQSEIKVEAEHLAPGFYYVHLFNSHKKVVKKIIVH
ncbi:T9SS type A sorting domain-containing protein [Rufibacter roseus]|uniref:T9SS type A sorting domain-containing protein n=1 Tax=Rufibacter roseus TaxID=1567108 RepID=A0ABW2DRL8_9BACT|nr:T9SS type A sorting domain-containing protein [Rufibacter roseus]